VSTAFERVSALLERIDKVNPAVNAIVALDRAGALAAASAADDARARGESLGPLHGVPVTVKDAIHVAGLPVTWGAIPGIVAEADATVVTRLRRAGAIVVGKTNVPPMLADFGQTANELFGVTNNPWDLARAPGGSSGGSAAALAAGMTHLEYGSDLVGSIRLPAAACGVYGLRPTADTVPLTGFRPPGAPDTPLAMTYLAALGPLATSAGDLRTALRVTGGPADASARAYSWTLAPPRHTRLSDFRVGVVLDDPACPVLPGVGAALSTVVDALAGAGVPIVEGWPPGVDPREVGESFGEHVSAFFAFTEGTGLGDLAPHEARRMAVRASWERHFRDVDVFLCPANFTTAVPHDPRPFASRTIGDRSYTDQAFWITHASLPGLPSVVAPVGFAAGLPVAVQILGPAHEDDTAITFAELLAELVGGFTPAPV
jgi:amidase